ncbi:Hypothetical predicted protein [Olea europaea subsp. europaea]|uniref:Uncharacterized protein n=1 Tax=Olea europaea subsp. europaea TaxID=158383 RepID=A0A8S0U1W7_OLEEU|nr:Hypothetical predicted protein [Olea europaea subsp. europaea]
MAAAPDVGRRTRELDEVWVGLRAIRPFFLAGLGGRVRKKDGPFEVGPKMFNGNGNVQCMLLKVNCNEQNPMESIDGTLGGKIRPREFEGKLGQFAGILRVGREKGSRFLIEVKEYLRELGCFALWLRLLLRLWVEELDSWMMGYLHVPNQTSIRESIDDTLGGKMRLREFEGKPGQFAGILRVEGEKGFGL